MRRHSFDRAIGLAVALTLWASAALAQAPDGGRSPLADADGMMGPGGDNANPLTIALAPAVQSELKLTEAQKTKVYAVAKQVGQRTRETFRGLLLGGNANPQALLMARANMRREIDQSLARVLDKKQRERLNQIVMRAEGPMAVARPEVADKLNLTPDQVTEVQAVMVQWQQSQRAMLMQARAGGALGADVDNDAYAQMRLASSRLRRDAGQQIGQILDRKQKFLFDKMLGAPFDLGKLNGDGKGGPDTPADATKAADTKDKANAKDSGEDSPKKKADTTGKRRKGRRDRTKTDP
jgi:hypothetical protein